MIYLQLFFSFLKVGMFSVGGGYAAIPLIQSQAVEACGWLTMDEFTNLVTIAEMTPGPIAINAATYYKYKGGSFVSSVMSSLRPAVVALIAAAGLSMLNTAVFNGRAASIGNLDVISAALFLLAFLLLRTRKWNPILVMCLCGAANLAIGTALQ